MGDLEDVERLSAEARAVREQNRQAIRDRNAAIWRARDNGAPRRDVADRAGLGPEAIDRICREYQQDA